MMRVVIVEDETLVRLGLKSCLENDSRLWVAGAFATAEEAETYFEHQSADILITDIRMANMTGLELVRRLRPRHPDMVMIVLTCYADFSYAQKALEYGVDRYLLKHELDETALPDMLVELAGGVKNPAPVSAAPLPLTPQRWLEDRHGKTVTAWFCFRGREDAVNATWEDINMEMLSGIIDTVLRDYHLGSAFIWRESSVIALLDYDDSLTEQANLGKYRACFQNITKSLDIYLDKLCFAGLSNVFCGEEQLASSVSAAQLRCGLSFYASESCLFADDRRKPAPCPPLKLIREDVFSAAWLTRTKKQLEQFVQTCIQLQPPVDEVAEAVMRFLHAMTSLAERNYGLNAGQAYDPASEPSYRVISQFDSLAAMELWILKIIDQTIEAIRSQSDLTVRIREYLMEHYNEELLQADVAARFHMSGPYFSQYFKEAFGVNYVQYLNNLRIEQAKLLLVTTRSSTESIAEQVGIPNVNYFFRLFKKMEGCTVKEYRSQHREHEKSAEIEKY